MKEKLILLQEAEKKFKGKLNTVNNTEILLLLLRIINIRIKILYFNL